MSISIIIPTLEEEKSIANVIEGVKPICDEIIVVDGHSKDKTVEIAEGYGVKIAYDRGGKGSAVRVGFENSTCDYMIMIDADESHQIDEIKNMIKLLESGYDVVMPSRFMAGGGSEDITRLRVFGNNFYKFWVRLFWKVSYTDICYGFRGLRREAVKKLELEADGFDIELEMSIRCAKKRLRYIEVPSIERERMFGTGKLTFWTSLLLDKRIIRELLRD